MQKSAVREAYFCRARSGPCEPSPGVGSYDDPKRCVEREEFLFIEVGAEIY